MTAGDCLGVVRERGLMLRDEEVPGSSQPGHCSFLGAGTWEECGQPELLSGSGE